MSDQQTVALTVASRDYSWNSGMFICQVDHIIEKLQRQLPDTFDQLLAVKVALGTPDFKVEIGHICSQRPKKQLIMA